MRPMAYDEDLANRIRELVADGHGFATAVLDVQARLLRPSQAASG